MQNNLLAARSIATKLLSSIYLHVSYCPAVGGKIASVALQGSHIIVRARLAGDAPVSDVTKKGINKQIVSLSSTNRCQVHDSSDEDSEDLDEDSEAESLISRRKKDGRSSLRRYCDTVRVEHTRVNLAFPKGVTPLRPPPALLPVARHLPPTQIKGDTFSNLILRRVSNVGTHRLLISKLILRSVSKHKTKDKQLPRATLRHVSTLKNTTTALPDMMLTSVSKFKNQKKASSKLDFETSPRIERQGKGSPKADFEISCRFQKSKTICSQTCFGDEFLDGNTKIARPNVDVDSSLTFEKTKDEPVSNSALRQYLKLKSKATACSKRISKSVADSETT